MSIHLFDTTISEASGTVGAVLKSGHIGHGPHIHALEHEFEKLLPSHTGVTFANMTVAIETALFLSDISQGDEVLALSFNCLSSNAPIHNIGARPVWVDLDIETGTMDIADATRQITSKTKALIVYHIAGYPADVVALRNLCDEFGLILIEDANASFGARLPQGLPIGSVGDFSVFSFYANRQVNGAEGAILMCRDPRSAELGRHHRRFGIDLSTFRDSRGQINESADVKSIGIAGNLNNLNASIALSSLESADARMSITWRNAKALADGLSSAPHINVIPPLAGSIPAYWVFLIFADYQAKVLDLMLSNGIGCTKLHHPNHLYSGFNSSARPLPSTQRFSNHVLALPVGWWLDLLDIERIVVLLNSFSSTCSNHLP